MPLPGGHHRQFSLSLLTQTKVDQLLQPTFPQGSIMTTFRISKPQLPGINNWLHVLGFHSLKSSAKLRLTAASFLSGSATAAHSLKNEGILWCYFSS